MLKKKQGLFNVFLRVWSELGTFEWWISGLMHDPLFVLISRLKNASSPLVINLKIN